MREDFFIKCMLRDESITSKEKAVASRLSKARKVEDFLGTSFDKIVQDDELMRKSLISIKRGMGDTHGVLSNTLRKYYFYENGKQFPRIKEYDER